MNTLEHYQDAARGIEPDTVHTLALSPANLARYSGGLDGLDLTDAQKHELLTTLWSILRSFVELGFRADLGAVLPTEADELAIHSRNDFGYTQPIP